MNLMKFKNQSRLAYPGSSLHHFTGLNDFFSDLFDDMVVSAPVKTTVPAVNIIESDETFTLEMAAPGRQKADFKIIVKDDILSISSELKAEKINEHSKYSQKEFTRNSFSRSFTLPATVNPEGIAASYENGVLILSIPKKEEAKPRQPLEVLVG